jgi:hypothetical protein
MTVVEARERRDEIARLVERQRAPSSPVEGLASEVVARARIATSSGERGWRRSLVAAAVEVPADPRRAMLEGTALLLEKRGEFRDWSRLVSPDLKARLAPDGLARGAAVGARVEETAWIVLALEVPYRTY